MRGGEAEVLSNRRRTGKDGVRRSEPHAAAGARTAGLTPAMSPVSC
jgi:hypothetical protein